MTPPGSGHKNKPTPEGSHVSSIFYGKAQNGIMETFIIARRKRYNENIYYRKAQNGHKHVTPPGSKHKNKPTQRGRIFIKEEAIFSDSLFKINSKYLKIGD